MGPDNNKILLVEVLWEEVDLMLAHLLEIFNSNNMMGNIQTMVEVVANTISLVDTIRRCMISSRWDMAVHRTLLEVMQRALSELQRINQLLTILKK